MGLRMSWDWVGDIPVGIYTEWVGNSHFTVEIKKGTRKNQNDGSISPSAPTWKKYHQQGMASKSKVVEKALHLCEIWLKESGEYQDWLDFWKKPQAAAYQKEEKVHINSNVTPEEFFDHFCTDENAKRFYEEGLENHTDEVESREIDDLQKREELLEEQLSWAKELIGELEHIIKRETRVGALRKFALKAIEESLFER